MAKSFGKPSAPIADGLVSRSRIFSGVRHVLATVPCPAASRPESPLVQIIARIMRFQTRVGVQDRFEDNQLTIPDSAHRNPTDDRHFQVVAKSREFIVIPARGEDMHL
jgi:hypothetical protein